MDKDTFRYLWDEGIAKAATDVYNDISRRKNGELIEKYQLQIDLSDNMYERVYAEYDSMRKRVRLRYFNGGDDEDNRIDSHKICACITGALLNVAILQYSVDKPDIPAVIVCSNYAIAFFASIYVLYLLVLSDYDKEGKEAHYNCLQKNGAFVFPETNPGHDSYVIGRIKTLALNDAYSNDFDVLTYADMLYWIEMFNKQYIDKQLSEL